jgi:hypothetical protein
MATQKSKITALPVGANGINKQLTPQISEMDCEVRFIGAWLLSAAIFFG